MNFNTYFEQRDLFGNDSFQRRYEFDVIRMSRFVFGSEKRLKFFIYSLLSYIIIIIKDSQHTFS